MLYASSPNPPFLGDMNPYLGIFGQLRNAFDLDLHAYKIGTIERRINQRMRRLGLTALPSTKNCWPREAVKCAPCLPT